MSFLGTLLGYIMWVCYKVIPIYGIALLMFTLITRLAMLPFTIKQQKSMGKMALVQPQIQELQKKYANNKEKLNEETMKLYQQEGYNPLSGCLPLLIQFPILFGLIDVIYKPLKHILHLPQEIIQIGEEIATKAGEGTAAAMRAPQLLVVSGVKANPADYSAMGAEAITQIQSLNLNFLGMDLTSQPAWDMFIPFDPLILIPFLSAISALFMSWLSQKNSANPQAGGGGSMKVMMYMMPLMSGWFAFQVPAGVGLYWFYSNIIAIGQQFLMNKLYNPKEQAEKVRLELEARKEKERQERIEAKRIAREKAALEAEEEAKNPKNKGKKKADPVEKEEPVLDEKALTAKEVNRRKLAEARKRDAEKYGEEYVEVTDDDLM